MNQKRSLGDTLRGLSLCVVAFLLLVICAACSSELASGLKESEAQEVVVILQQYGLTPKKEKVGEGKDATWTVTVPATEANGANQILRKFELPREKPKGLGEVFSNTGLIPTATEEKAMMLLALQGEISKTLETVDGVVSARVHVVLPEKNPLAEKEEKKATASVFVRYRGDHLPLTQEEVGQMVAHAVDGLEPQQVSVVMKPVEVDRSKIDRMKSDAGGIFGGNFEGVIMILGAFCVLLALILVVMVFRLQSAKKQNLRLRREMGASR